MSRIQRGIFVDLLMLQWRGGGVIDHDDLSGLNLQGEEIEICAKLIEKHFLETDEFIWNRELRKWFDTSQKDYRAKVRQTDLMNAKRSKKAEARRAANNQGEFLIDQESARLLEQQNPPSA